MARKKLLLNAFWMAAVLPTTLLSQGPPTFVWEPETLTIRLQPGTVVTVPVQVTSSVSLPRVVLSADARLASFFFPPGSLGELWSSKPTRIGLVFAVSSTVGEGTLTGEIRALLPFVRGDANYDTSIDISDAVRILLVLFAGAGLPCAEAADSNGDGGLDIADALYLLRHLFIEGPKPPAPYPEEGFDATPGTLPCFGGAVLPVTLEVAFPASAPEGFTAPSGDRVVLDDKTGQTISGEELFMIFPLGTPLQEGVRVAEAAGGIVTGSRPQMGFYEVRFPGALPEELTSIANTLMAANPDVVTGKSTISGGLALTPDDQEYGREIDTPENPRWEDQNPAEGPNYGLELIQAVPAWDLETGSPETRIAIIDNFTSGHEDLARAEVKLREAGGNPNNFHGIHVAGIAGADANTDGGADLNLDKGIAGVCWGCSLELYNAAFALTKDFLGNVCSSPRYPLIPFQKLLGDLVYQAIACTDCTPLAQKRLVVNLSIGYYNPCFGVLHTCSDVGFSLLLPEKRDAAVHFQALKQLIDFAKGNGVELVLVVAAGNETMPWGVRDVSCISPARYSADFPDNIITVASVDPDGRLSSFSNFGDQVTVAAPGKEILSLGKGPCGVDSETNYCRSGDQSNYCCLDGTSMATPFVAGLVGLLWSAEPNLTAGQVVERIKLGARLGSRLPVPGHCFYTINAYKTLEIGPDPDVGPGSEPTDGLVSWWHADGDAQDSVGSNHGNTQNGATFGPGVMGQAFRFDGVDDLVEVPDQPTLKPQHLTVACWVNITSRDSTRYGGAQPAVGLQYIIFKQNSHTQYFEGYTLLKGSPPCGELAYFAASFGGTLEGKGSPFSTPLMALSQWYHVAGTFDGQVLKLYVNGLLEGEQDHPFPLDGGSRPLYFGRTGNAGYDAAFSGLIDEVMLYNRALSPEEIRMIYVAQRTSRPPRESARCALAAPMPTPRWGPPMVGVIDGQLHVVGGQIDENNDRAEHDIYNPARNAWTSAAPLTMPRSGGGAAVIDGVLYVAGGFSYSLLHTDVDNLDRYDPAAGWTPLTPMLSPLRQMAVAAIGGKLYVVGGTSDALQRSTDMLQVYDPDTGWELKTPMPTARASMGAGEIDGKLYVPGGAAGTFSDMQVLNTLEVYDPGFDSWASLVPMPEGRVRAAVVVLNRRLYVIGGAPAIFGPAEATVYVYEPDTDGWTTQNPMPTARFGMGADVIDGRLYVVGGYTGIFPESGMTLATLEFCTPVTTPPRAGLISWWRADGDAQDSADGSHGTLHGGAEFVPGVSGQAFHLHGMDDFVEVPNFPNISEAITVTAWIRYTSLLPDMETRTIVAKADNNGNLAGWTLHLKEGVNNIGVARFIVYDDNGGASAVSTGPVDINTWHFVAASNDGIDQRIYLDGNVISSIENSGRINPARSVLLMGRSDESHVGGPTFFAGFIDEVMLYNRPLAAEEVNTIYESQRPR